MPIADTCYHVPTSPGQTVCGCLDLIMWTRLLVELQARRIVELEREAQQGVVTYHPVSEGSKR
jgi:hypothetical protein